MRAKPSCAATVSSCRTNESPHGLDRHHALAQTGRVHHTDFVPCRPAPGLLAGSVAIPLEISHRSFRGPSAGASANRAGILHPAGAWTAQSHRTVLPEHDGTSPAIFISGTAHRLRAVQPAVHRAAIRGRVLVG